jgi:hypothetical protein
MPAASAMLAASDNELMEIEECLMLSNPAR